jgi:hypothetical protein
MPVNPMPAGRSPWRIGRATAATVVALLLPLLVPLLVLLLNLESPALADTLPMATTYVCDGEPLRALLVRGSMDDAAIPDPSSGPVPIGAVVTLQWRGMSLQLPRTNNAGPASFSDGKWWWSLEDPSHPRFRLRRSQGDVQDFNCGTLG